jgi:ankyrin repeat protein
MTCVTQQQHQQTNKMKRLLARLLPSRRHHHHSVDNSIQRSGSDSKIINDNTTPPKSPTTPHTPKDSLFTRISRRPKTRALSSPVLLAASTMSSASAALIAMEEEEESLKQLEQEEQLIQQYQESELHIAAIRGDVEKIEQLIATVENIVTFCCTKVGKDENTALHLAASRGHLQVVTQLINYGVNVNIVNKQLLTPLHSACSKNRREVSQFLIANGADLTKRDSMGFCPFHIACISSAFDIAEDILLSGGDIETKRFDGKTALHIVSEQGNVDALKFLIQKHSVNTMAKDQKGNTALICAVKKNRIPVVKYFFQCNNVNMNQMLKHRNQLGRNIIHVCVDDFDREEIAYEMTKTVIQLLFQMDSQLLKSLLVEQDKVCKYTSLHCAVRRNYPHVVALLLKYGIDSNLGDEKENTALHLALTIKMKGNQIEHQWISNNLLVIQTLIEYPNTKLNIKSNEGKQTAESLLKSRPEYHSIHKDLKKIRKEGCKMWSQVT